MNLIKEEEKELEDLLKKETKVCSAKGYITTFVVILIIVTLIIFWKKFSKKIIVWIFAKIGKIVKIKFPFNFGVIFFVDLFWVTLNIPALSFLTLAIASISQNFWATFITVMMVHNVHAFSTYFVVTKCLKKKLDKKFRGHILYRLMKNEGKHSPVLVSSTIRWIGAFQTMMKSVIIALSEINFKTFYFTFMVQILYDSFVFAYIGANVKFNGSGERLDNRSFKDKSSKEKFNVIMTWIITGFTILVLVTLPLLAKMRINEFKKREKDKMVLALRCKFLLENEVKNKIELKNSAFSVHNLGSFDAMKDTVVPNRSNSLFAVTQVL